MRYNLATLAELRVFEPLATPSTSTASREVDAMMVAVGNGPSFGGGLRITEGALLDDGLLDVVFFHPMSKADLVRTYPRLFNGTHRATRLRAPPGPPGDRRRARHRRLRRRRAARPRCRSP